MRLSAAIVCSFAWLGGIAAAQASGCPGNPGAMGTSRVLTIDPREYPRIGVVQYQETLPLNDKEVVLTFDDGPMPPYTNRVLETLAHECVKANYFIVGRMARGYPDLLRRIAAEGHVIGTHSENHPLAFERMPQRAVEAEIEQGFASTAGALGNQGTVAPFFRIPGLLRAEGVENYLRSRGRVTWSADVVADDWKHITASEVVSRALARLDARGKGILLLHDIQPATALALPHLLRELKRRGYKIVQVAPASGPPLVASAPRPAVASNTTTTTVMPKQQPQQQQPQRETSSWPTPYPAGTPAAAVRREPAATTTTVTRVTPEVLTTKPAELPPAAAAAIAASQPSAERELSPPSRAMPMPILEAAAPNPPPAAAEPSASGIASADARLQAFAQRVAAHQGFRSAGGTAARAAAPGGTEFGGSAPG